MRALLALSLAALLLASSTARADSVDELSQRLLGEPSPRLRAAAAIRLGRMGDSRVVKPLLAGLQDDDIEVRIAVIDALARAGDREALEALRAHVEGTPRPRDHLTRAIATLENLLQQIAESPAAPVTSASAPASASASAPIPDPLPAASISASVLPSPARNARHFVTARLRVVGGDGATQADLEDRTLREVARVPLVAVRLGDGTTADRLTPARLHAARLTGWLVDGTLTLTFAADRLDCALIGVLATWPGATVVKATIRTSAQVSGLRPGLEQMAISQCLDAASSTIADQVRAFIKRTG